VILREPLPPLIDDAPLRVAMLAPPWIAVPPLGYGGVESVVSVLTEALVARGGDVTLFCAPGSASSAHVEQLLDAPHPDEIERSLVEADHVARAFAAIDRAEPPFDVVHDHGGFTALSMADRVRTPMVHTMHGQLGTDTAGFYRRHGHKATLVAISDAQRRSAPAGLQVQDVIPNPVDIGAWTLRERKGDHLLWIGRITPDKGPHHAIAAARAAGAPLVLAGIVQPNDRAFFEREIVPHLDGDRVRFVGEVGGTAKQALFAGARGLLMPIRWAEPFGMVIVEALACGTPVIAFPEGAAQELIVDGATGFLVADVDEMAAAVARLPEIDGRTCRGWVSANCDVEVVAAAYERVYHAACSSTAAALHA